MDFVYFLLLVVYFLSFVIPQYTDLILGVEVRKSSNFTFYRICISKPSRFGLNAIVTACLADDDCIRDAEA